MIRRLARAGLKLVLFGALFSVLWVGAYRWVNPPVTYLMAAEWIRLGDITRDWRSLEQLPDHLPRAAMAAEDARFCDHWGFDFVEIEKALKGDSGRGASTISQQVAKNVFLWPGRNWARKGLEAGFTVLIEALWPKRRIIEVYLNVAEFGEGAFGAEAGANAAYGIGAADLTPVQAARMIAVLPNPRNRDPNAQTRRGRQIAGGAETLRQEGRADCLAR